MKNALLAVCGLIVLAACNEDKDNRVISKHVSPGGHSFHLMPILEDGVSDVTVAAAWYTDWTMTPGNNLWAPALATQLMISGGTADLAPPDVLELFDEHGSYGEIFATVDTVYAEVEFPNHKEDEILPVLSELFQTPQFDEKWLERTRGEFLESLDTAEQPVALQMWEASRYAVLGEGPQLTVLNGKGREDLVSLTRDDLLKWHAASVAKTPTMIVVTGGIKADDAGEVVDRLFPAPEPSDVVPHTVQPADFTRKVIYLNRPEAEKSVIGFLGALPDTRDGLDSVDLTLFNVFSGGAGSPLFERIRSDLGATYGMSAGYTNYSRRQRLLFIAGEIDTDKMADVREAVLAAYAEFLTDPDLTELGNMGQRVAESLRNDLEYVNTSARFIRETLLDELDEDVYHTLPNMVEELTEEQAKDRLTTAFPKAEDLLVFAVGSDPSAFPDACVIEEPYQAEDC